MRKILHAIIGVITASFLFSSCLDNDDTTTEYTSDALISSFSINDIETSVASKTADGEDTTLIVTTTGSDYVFTVNQNENRIYNSDSLPVGTDISKVTLSLSVIGYAVTYEKNQRDTLWTSNDSIDFTSPVNFKVYAYDGTTRSYQAQINVHRQDPDALQWTKMEGSNFAVGAMYRQKAIAYNNRIYVFAEGANQAEVTYTEQTDGQNWTALQELAGIEGTADYSSVTVFNGSLYILAQNKLYVSSDGTNWAEAGADRTFTRLFAASSTQLYGISGGNIVASDDASAWTEIGEVTASFPTKNLSFTISTLATNSTIERMTVVGVRDAESDTTAVVWSKLSTENRWMPLSQQADNFYGCPKLKELAVIHYDGKLYAFGGEKDFVSDSPTEAFGVLYQSVDHGLTWKPATGKVMLDEAFAGRSDYFSYVVDNDQFIWILWSGSGEVWRGKINRLGFAGAKE